MPFKRRKRRQSAVEVADQRRFGHLQFEPSRIQTRFGQDILDELGKSGRVELHGRNVDRHAERIDPCRGFGTGDPRHPFADLQDRAALLRDGNEQGRRHDAPLGVLHRNKASNPTISPVSSETCG